MSVFIHVSACVAAKILHAICPAKQRLGSHQPIRMSNCSAARRKTVKSGAKYVDALLRTSSDRETRPGAVLGKVFCMGSQSVFPLLPPEVTAAAEGENMREVQPLTVQKKMTDRCESVNSHVRERACCVAPALFIQALH